MNQLNDSLRLLRAYVHHRWASANSKGHGVHSPFLFSFINQVLHDSTIYEDYRAPEVYRQALLRAATPFNRLDLGAGSRTRDQAVTVQSMARRSLQPVQWARLLYRIVRRYKPGSILELGTSFGVTTQYLTLADPTQPVYTLEGDPFIARRASEQFSAAGLDQIEVIEGNFEDHLEATLRRMERVGLALIDGNHRKEPTLRYFEQILPFVHNDSILIFDDVYWSAPMQAAWQTIQQHPRVCGTIDLFRMGIVFFRSEFREPIHIRLHY